MADIAQLGILVDATGARREIQLTREELIRLANGGREARDVLRGAIPPLIVPPGVPRQIDGVTQAIQRMRQAAAQGQANAMASQIGFLDPFQRQAQSIQAATTAAAHSHVEMGKLRSGLTTLAISAGAVPGPIGRIASTLAPLAMGSGLTVGVLAAITAIAFAWKKFTEEGDRARDMMRALRDDEARFGADAMRARISALQHRERNLASGFEASGRKITDFTLPASNRRAQELQEARDHMNELGRVLAKGERDNATKRTAEAQRGADDRREIERKFAADAAAEFDRSFDRQMKGARDAAAANAKEDIERAKEVADAELEAEKAAAIAAGQVWDEIAEKRLQKMKAMQHLAQWGLSKADPAFGQTLQIGTSLLASNWLGAAQGVTSLIDSIIGLGDASKEQAKGIVAEIQARRSFQESLQVEMGEMTETEFKIAEANRRFAAERANFSGSSEELDKMNDLQRRYVEWLRKEGDAKERLNTAMRNAPSGFFVERYLQSLASPGATRVDTWANTSSGSSGRSGTSVTVGPGGVVVNINGSETPAVMAKKLAQALDILASTTGGAGMSRADALNRVS